MERYAHLIDEIRSGKLCLILDAVDEAIVASTSSNFVASLQNLAEVIGKSESEEACVIFFGRPETITDTYLYLSDLGIESEVLEVSYFSEADAKKFVREQVIAAEGSALGELDIFIDTFFSRVQDAFNSEDWTVVGSFLGYAPVLDSLALFYRESDNAYRELNGFVSDGSKTWSLIGSMLQRVLNRETEKFANSFGGPNEAKRLFAASAYSMETQVRWLLADDLASMGAEPDLSLAEETEWLADIEQSLRDQFDVHPFLKSQRGEHSKNVLLGFTSAAFRDFVLAQFLKCASGTHLDVLQAYWLQPEVVPSMMLSRFLRTVCGEQDLLDARVMAFILDSHSNQNGENAELMYVELADDSDPFSADSEDYLSLSFDSDPDGSSGLQMKLRGPALELGRSAAYSVISVPNMKVIVGAQLAECDLGPRLAIECETFSAQSTEVHINHIAMPASSSGGSRLGANVRVKKLEGIVRKITGSREVFSVSVPVAPYPWQPFKKTELKDEKPTEADLLLAGLALRRIAVWFGRGGMRFARSKMDTILSKGRASQQLFVFLMSRGLIWNDDTFYRMGGEVSIGSIRSLDFTDREYTGLVVEACGQVDL
ncbi:hypothetical protein A5740_25145 [Mycobacterium sp. GA-1841]|nr:hypothetical protein A5740_25145 [Mycobacterium sp. GA-1841]